MVNFGGVETMPDKFKDRHLHVHNSEVTLMRTSVEECREIARWIAGKVNKATSPMIILIPEKGVSLIDKPGQPFHDVDADKALFDELESAITQDEIRQIRRLPYNINDPEFSQAIVDAYFELNLNPQDK